MVTASVTSKGQITIPKGVRESLRLRTGDRVAFIVKNPTEAVLKPVTRSVDDLFGKLHDPRVKPRTVAEMNHAIRRRLRSENP